MTLTANLFATHISVAVYLYLAYLQFRQHEWAAGARKAVSSELWLGWDSSIYSGVVRVSGGKTDGGLHFPCLAHK